MTINNKPCYFVEGLERVSCVCPGITTMAKTCWVLPDWQVLNQFVIGQKVERNRFYWIKFPVLKRSPTLWLIVLCSRPRITRMTVCPSKQRSSAAFPSRTTYRYPTGSGPNTPGSSSSSTTTSWKDTRLPETSWKRWRTRPSKKCWIFSANSESMSLRMARYAANRTYFTFAGAFRVSTLTTWFPRASGTERSWVRCRWSSAKWKRKAMLLG